MSDEITQWVCETRPACLCAGDDDDDNELDEYTCDCAVVLGERRCSNCNAPMAEIDTDTGVKVHP